MPFSLIGFWSGSFRAYRHWQRTPLTRHENESTFRFLKLLSQSLWAPLAKQHASKLFWGKVRKGGSPYMLLIGLGVRALVLKSVSLMNIRFAWQSHATFNITHAFLYSKAIVFNCTTSYQFYELHVKINKERNGTFNFRSGPCLHMSTDFVSNFNLLFFADWLINYKTWHLLVCQMVSKIKEIWKVLN